MPQLVTKQIKARELVKGDIVVINDTDTAPLTKIDKKQKYVWIADETGTDGRLGMADTVTIKRLEDTPAEREEKYKEYLTRTLTRRMVAVINSFDLAAASLADEIKKNGQLTHWMTDRFVEAQETYRIWKTVEMYMESDGLDILQATNRKAKLLLSDILDAARGSGRSTSSTYNAFENIKLSAASKFVSEVTDI